MKNPLIYLLLVSLYFILSCEENFSPIDELKDQYILNCILRGDSTLHFATVSKTFLTEGDPRLTNPAERFISGTDIRIWNGDKVYRFKDSVIVMKDGDDEFPLNVYYSDQFIPEQRNTLEIVALTPDGRRLKSSTIIPKAPRFNRSSNDTIVPPGNKDFVSLHWTQEEPDLIYAPEINLYYFQIENGIRVRKIAKVPVEYVVVDGEFVPNYPQPSKANAFSISMAAIDRLMKSISEGDDDKQNYTILTMILDVHVYDINLSNYYVSTSQILDDFSVQLDEVEFSNLEGGLGIFGSFITKKYVLKFDREYVYSFGYVPGINP